MASVGLAILVACNGQQAAVRTPPAETSGTSPRAVGDDLFVCPGGFGVAAYGQVFYFDNDPRKPDASVRPDRCFASADEARDAGYALAPPPAGGLIVDDVYLVVPSPSLLPICRRAAEELGFTVLCPTVIPAPPDSLVECSMPNCVAFGVLLFQFSLSGPPGYAGTFGNANHVFVLESRAGRERTVGYLTCSGAKVVGRFLLSQEGAQWIRCPAGSELNSGHVMLVWTKERVRHAVSLHSDTPVNRDLALAIAGRLVPVSP